MITIFGHHFDVNTHIANDQVDTYVDQFKNAFGDIHYLQPLGYFDTKGRDVTGDVHINKRPPNLAYVLVQAKMPLGKIHSTFGPDELFTHQYYLALPQTYNATLPPAPPEKLAAAPTAEEKKGTDDKDNKNVGTEGNLVTPVTPIRKESV